LFSLLMSPPPLCSALSCYRQHVAPAIAVESKEEKGKKQGVFVDISFSVKIFLYPMDGGCRIYMKCRSTRNQKRGASLSIPTSSSLDS
jgi:hypothetical protein